MKIIYRVMLLLLFSSLALAKPATYSQHHDFLVGGFNISHYQQCKALLKKCYVGGFWPKVSCVKPILARNKVCKQYQQLLKVVGMSTYTVFLEKMGNLTLLRMFFMADGQNWYKVMTPKGNIIDTQIDPRKLDKSLATKYHKTSFMIADEEKPKYTLNANGSQTIITIFDVQNTCLACETIGTAKIKFQFSKDGSFQQPPKLISFLKAFGPLPILTASCT